MPLLTFPLGTPSLVLLRGAVHFDLLAFVPSVTLLMCGVIDPPSHTSAPCCPPASQLPLDPGPPQATGEPRSPALHPSALLPTAECLHPTAPANRGTSPLHAPFPRSPGPNAKPRAETRAHPCLVSVGGTVGSRFTIENAGSGPKCLQKSLCSASSLPLAKAAFGSLINIC